MFCRKRQRVHASIIDFIKDRSIWRDELQITDDWVNDLWYIWLSVSPNNVALVRDNYVNDKDFQRLFEFANGGKHASQYRISLWQMLEYAWYRPVYSDMKWVLSFDQAATCAAEASSSDVALDEEDFGEDGIFVSSKPNNAVTSSERITSGEMQSCCPDDDETHRDQKVSSPSNLILHSAKWIDNNDSSRGIQEILETEMESDFILTTTSTSTTGEYGDYYNEKSGANSASTLAVDEVLERSIHE